MVRLVQDTGLAVFMREIAEAVEEDYKRWGEFEKAPRYAAHAEHGVIELMPASDDHHFAFKYVNGHPDNYKHGFQTIVAFGVYSAFDNGYPLMLSEMTLGTALRTAATSALAAKYLARPDSKTMTMIGNGCQAEFQAHAFKEMIGIENLRLYDIDAQVSEKLAKNLEDAGFNITICKSSQEAVIGADIVTTCTADKQLATILTDNMVGHGIHINAIGGDCPGKTELHDDILKRGSVFVEYEPQSRIEGDIQQMPDDFPVTELHDVFSGNKPGRQNTDQITVFDSVGFALQDFSFLRLLYQKIEGTDYYEELDMIEELEDQRDLFSLLKK